MGGKFNSLFTSLLRHDFAIARSAEGGTPKLGDVLVEVLHLGLQGLEPLGSASFPLDAGSMGEPFASQGVLALKDGQGSIGLRWAWVPAGLRAGGAEAAPLRSEVNNFEK